MSFAVCVLFCICARFWRNDVDLGIAFSDVSVPGGRLVPAVCLGSASGGKSCTVTIVTPGVRTFDPARCHAALTVDGDSGKLIAREGVFWAFAVACAACRSDSWFLAPNCRLQSVRGIPFWSMLYKWRACQVFLLRLMSVCECVRVVVPLSPAAASVDGRLLAPWYTALCRHIGVCEGVVVFAVRFDAGDDDDDVVIGVASAALDWTSQVIGEQ